MRISMLAERTGLPVATLKYYLREGLVPPGIATARTQALYDEAHVARVLLVRALTESASLSLAAVRQVLAVLDDPPASRHDLLGAAQHALLTDEERSAGTPGAPAADPWLSRAAAVVAARGWYCDTDDPLVRRLAEGLRAADAADVTISDEHLDAYARASETIADADVASVPADAAGAMRQVVVGTLLTDPLILTLRRIAQQQASDTAAARPTS
ncbi:MerR-like DNA binding protein [Promicromonospora sp. AC04]|uniref:MerR family transcriptional regulator n=1 Tax=Promicromonospora sp. AC04 TaxID=2135723 RepID=UPI000D35CD06|nr:MerR family transcriptional regulator [Promicromonospora sp. AC04]PUB27079.1 MerR-like DNA binding protein [Promicromonospora sp. AC04]